MACGEKSAQKQAFPTGQYVANAVLSSARDYPRTSGYWIAAHVEEKYHIPYETGIRYVRDYIAAGLLRETGNDGAVRITPKGKAMLRNVEGA
ncbi:MAG: hypothetical protein M1160_01160 [Candidatus Marsarchaeota archaeon]|nr:hypothetical protein [Candidatus Marsarchaeota archaeon]MCL5111476.1 hypothetical protein [Candidatus Marsarchaeota archaeon]